jgi:hypothetical protein
MQPIASDPNLNAGTSKTPTRQLRLPRSQQRAQSMPGTPGTPGTRNQSADPSPETVAHMIALEVDALENKAKIDRGNYPPMPSTPLREAFQEAQQSESGAASGQ